MNIVKFLHQWLFTDGTVYVDMFFDMSKISQGSCLLHRFLQEHRSNLVRPSKSFFLAAAHWTRKWWHLIFHVHSTSSITWGPGARSVQIHAPWERCYKSGAVVSWFEGGDFDKCGFGLRIKDSSVLGWGASRTGIWYCSCRAFCCKQPSVSNASLISLGWREDRWYQMLERVALDYRLTRIGLKLGRTRFEEGSGSTCFKR